jgi:ubiquinone/menaquinone biosynthesis C-methylase UbiE
VSTTRQFYGRWARLYDWLATAPGVRSWRQRAVEALDLEPGDVAVEMGYGSGANLPYLRRAVGPAGTVVGVDLTRAMLLAGRDRGGHLVQGDATRPPVAGPVDGLLGTFVVGMFDDPGAVVQRWCDLVTPGGRVALLHFTRSERRWTRPLNAVYRAFVWASSAGKPVRDVAGDHDRRVRQAGEALAARTVDAREETFAAGYLRLVDGRVPGD